MIRFIIRSVVFLAAVAAFLSACTTTDDYRRSYSNYAERAPRLAGVSYGWGEGETLQEATSGAIRDVAQQVEIRVASSVEATSFQVEEDGQISFREEFTEELDLETDLVLKNIVRIDDFVTPDGYTFALAMYADDTAFVSPRSVGEQLRESARRRRVVSSVLSGVVPGIGQIRDGFQAKGFGMAAVGFASGLTSVFGFIQSNSYYHDYLTASNNTERDIYFRYAQMASAVGIAGAISYAASSIISVVDIWGSERP